MARGHLQELLEDEEAMKESKDHWWAVLLNAELQSEIQNHCHKDGKGALRSLQVAMLARRKLMTEYGVNFDKIGYKARDAYSKLYQQELDKEKAKEAKDRETDAMLARIKAELNLGDDK
jgi:hypothetical protein